MHRVALLVGLLLVPSCGPTRRPPELGQAERLASHGKIVEARKLLKVFDFSVATGLNRMLLDTNKRIDSWQKTFRVVDGELRAKLQRKTRYQVLAWARDQQRTADAAGNYYRAQAFLARMSQIEGFSKGIERIEDDPGGEPEPETRVVVEDDNESDLLGGALDNFLEDCTKLAAQGQYREAAKRLRNMMPLAGLGADRVRKALAGIKGVGPYCVSHMIVLLGDYSEIPVDSEVLKYLRKTHFRGKAVSPAKATRPYEKYGSFRFLAFKFARMGRRLNYIDK